MSLPGYDAWKLSGPRESYYPLQCQGCNERFFDIEDQPETHCCNPDEHDDPTHTHGELAWDYSYDWRDDDPRIP